MAPSAPVYSYANCETDEDAGVIMTTPDSDCHAPTFYPSSSDLACVLYASLFQCKKYIYTHVATYQLRLVAERSQLRARSSWALLRRRRSFDAPGLFLTSYRCIDRLRCDSIGRVLPRMQASLHTFDHGACLRRYSSQAVVAGGNMFEMASWSCVDRLNSWHSPGR